MIDRAPSGPSFVQVRPGWQKRAACAGHPDPELFATNPNTPARRVREAKQVCAGCPVIDQCLQEGLYESGIWGGLTEHERRLMLRVRVSL